MKVTVKIDKSFDGGKQFSKEYENGDFLDFFSDEGEYLDRLSSGVATHGDTGEGFVVTYTVTVSK